MKLIKVGAAVLNQTPFDWEHNTNNIKSALEAARQEEVTVLCLPELCITGYGCEDDFFRIDLRERAWKILHELLPLTRGMIVSLGLPVLYNNALFNCAAMVCDGKLLGLVAKQNLAGDGIHYEPRWFEPWTEGVASSLVTPEGVVPIGEIYFDINGIKVGFEICEDAWVGKRPGGKLARKGVDIILNPSASHFSFGKMDIRKRLVLEGSRAFCASYVYSNLLGNESGRAIYDGGAIIASAGKLIAQGNRFSFADFELTTGVIDVDHTRMAQSRSFSYRPELSASDPNRVPGQLKLPHLTPDPQSTPILSPWETSDHLREEEFSRSISLGLFDYLRKTRSRGYTVSLSGGADSSCVCMLVTLMVEFAIQNLGLDKFKERLSYISELKDKNTKADILGSLLTCAYQASDNSSENTLSSARDLASAIGAQFFEFNISKVVDQYTSMVEGALGKKLSWETDDIALQNIQARVRSPGIWMLANLTNSVLLCTSNRSEGAVGYCTMDGDTSGGLAPVAGVDKNFIRRWLRWMEKSGPSELEAHPELSTVNQQIPGPELRPKAAAQAGERDLMPYEVLDAIEEAAIENNQSVRDCYELMRSRFPSYTAWQVASWVEKFFTLWSRNQWKRERLAPALHVASRNLDPRTWRRSPIISGAFHNEIAEMWVLAKSEIENRKRALLVIDAQKGFGSQGELAVPDAEAIVPVVNELSERFDFVVASQDWHPPDHVSFAPSHKSRAPGDVIEVDGIKQPLFPVHCVRDTPGSEFLDGLEIERFKKVFRKGTASGVDSLSAFNDNTGKKATDIEDYLRKHRIDDVYVTGLATNYCVFMSAMDAVKAGFTVYVVTDACRGIDNPPGAIQASLEEMKAAGIKLVTSQELLSGAQTKSTAAV